MKDKINLTKLLRSQGEATMTPKLRLLIERLFKLLEFPEILYLFVVCSGDFNRLFSTQLQTNTADGTPELVLEPSEWFLVFMAAVETCIVE